LKRAYANIAFILFIIAVAFFPVWTFIFSLKNDFFTQYFLQRFFIGQSISNHVFPLWNPYMNYGLPVYNDMNGGFWYPLTWINGLFTGYSAYSFTIEECIHFPVAAAGMYLLCRYHRLQTPAKIIAAISYACCGYFVAHTQHYNWITGAAWLPWCILTMYRCMDKLTLKNLSLSALTFSLFISGSHPGLMIGSLYFFFIIAAFHMRENRAFLPAVKNLLALFSLVVIIMAGLIYSYSEIIPLFTRSGKIFPADIAFFSTPPYTYFSFFLPLPFTQIGEEISMNNNYVGLLIMVSVIAGIFRNGKPSSLYLPATALFFLLLSTNFPISLWLIQKLPLLQFVRLNGELRIFGMLPLLLFGAIQFDALFYHQRKYLRNICVVSSGLLMLTCLSAVFLYSGSLSSLTGAILWFFNANKTGSLKETIHSLGFGEMIILQSFIQSVLLLLMALCLMKKEKWLIWLVGTDIILATLLNLPFTGVSMRPVSAIQAIIKQSPAGFPIPGTAPEKNIYSTFPATDTLIGNWSFYSKQVAIEKWHPYPIQLKSSQKYFDRAHEALMQRNTGFIFTEESSVISIDKFSPNEFKVTASPVMDTRLTIKQNLYPGWITMVNKSVVTPDTAYFAFPGVTIKKGHNEISHVFRKPFVTFLFIFYWAGLFALAIALVLYITVYRNRN